jgi:hypothetical protein
MAIWWFMDGDFEELSLLGIPVNSGKNHIQKIPDKSSHNLQTIPENHPIPEPPTVREKTAKNRIHYRFSPNKKRVYKNLSICQMARRRKLQSTSQPNKIK